MDNYTLRFRNKMSKLRAAELQISDVIARSTSRVDVFVGKLNKSIPMVFITNDKESGDEVMIYTYSENGIMVGDYIDYFGKSHLVYKKINNVKRENYIDAFNAVACNAEFDLEGTTIKAYFKGTNRFVGDDISTVTESLGTILESQALLLLPNGILDQLNKKIKINGTGYKVVRLDKTTNPGISYISLETALIPEDKDSITETENFDFENTPSLDNILHSGLEYKVFTENGYIKFNHKVNIIKRTNTSVEFLVPIGISSLSVETMENGLLINTTYQVRR